MNKRIVLCADDYGQAPTVSQGIINLIQQGRLSATSCMVNTTYWAEHAKWLAPFRQQIDIGLHFNLTEGKALSQGYARAHGSELQPLSRLLCNAFLRKLDRVAIEAECHAQIDRFSEATGILPSYIDGHQHIHQFPIIREAVIHVYAKRLRLQNAYVRLVNGKLKIKDFVNDYKKIIIYATGVKALKLRLEQHNIPYNQSFAGIYAFARASEYSTLFPQFLREIDDQGLIMCHPGLNVSNASDVIANARFKEYQYFASNQFLEDCQEQKVSITRFF